MGKEAADTSRSAMNAALFARIVDHDFIREALKAAAPTGRQLFVGEEEGVYEGLEGVELVRFADLGLEMMPFDPHTVLDSIRGYLMSNTDTGAVVVDMSWAVEAIHGGKALELWGAITQEVSADFGVGILSLYNLDILIENQMQAALRAHRQFLAPSGLYENPFWLPEALASRATLDQQFAFLLGRAVPDYAGIEFFEPSDRGFARGAEPAWLARPRRIRAERSTEERWHIYCFGRLRVLKGGQTPVEWDLPGSAPKKTRTLFAYLLNSGEKGAPAERISELLWPDGLAEGVKRARLHHTIAMLRKTLGGRETVLRSGDYYRLNAPVGSWTDISSFEQTCRRGLSLAKQGQELEALKVYRAGVRLYTGDLFEEIPAEYVHSDLDDWCLPRRRWLREMVLKLLRDMSTVMRSQGEFDEALEQCQKALALDPTSEPTHREAMRVLHAQGRIDAVQRQYEQFISNAEANGNSHEAAEIHRVYDRLMH